MQGGGHDAEGVNQLVSNDEAMHEDQIIKKEAERLAGENNDIEQKT